MKSNYWLLTVIFALVALPGKQANGSESTNSAICRNPSKSLYS